MRRLSADAWLVPTRNLNNRKWFPSGPPAGAVQPPREAFTADRRVIRVEGMQVSHGTVGYGHSFGTQYHQWALTATRRHE